MADEFAETYEALYDEKLQEPKTIQDVKNVLECIRTSHGALDAAEQGELERSSLRLRKKVKLFTGTARKTLARFTKA